MTASPNSDDAPNPGHEAATMDAGDEAFARARSQVYALLAATIDGEMEVLRRAMAAGDFARFEGLIPGEFDAAALRREDVDAGALEVGYDNLFVVPGPHYVPPFASAHADDPTEQFESDSTYHEEGDPIVALRQAQRSFIDDGLDWLDAFAEAVEREDAAEGVFAALARFAAAVVKWDRQAVVAGGEGAAGTGLAST